MSDFGRSWAEIDRRYVDSKDSQGAIPELFQLYESLDPREREAANANLFASLRAGSEGQRYDALAIINQFQVREAVPHLRELAVRLETDESAGAPFELAKVERIIGKLLAR